MTHGQRDSCALQRFEPRHLDADVIGSGVQQRCFEIPATVGHHVLSHAGLHVRDFHGCSRDHALGIPNSSRDGASGFLSDSWNARQQQEADDPELPHKGSFQGDGLGANHRIIVRILKLCFNQKAAIQMAAGARAGAELYLPRLTGRRCDRD